MILLADEFSEEQRTRLLGLCVKITHQHRIDNVFQHQATKIAAVLGRLPRQGNMLRLSRETRLSQRNDRLACLKAG